MAAAAAMNAAAALLAPLALRPMRLRLQAGSGSPSEPATGEVRLNGRSHRP